MRDRARSASASSLDARRYSRRASGDGSSNASLSAASFSCWRSRTSASRRPASFPCTARTRRAPASSAPRSSLSSRWPLGGRKARRRCCRRGISHGRQSRACKSIAYASARGRRAHAPRRSAMSRDQIGRPGSSHPLWTPISFSSASTIAVSTHSLTSIFGTSLKSSVAYR
jgi:hypothetical protein